MSDKLKPRRRWFQFHLMTLILMALAAGGFLLVNTRERIYNEYATMAGSENPEKRLWRTQLWGVGWPCCYFQTRATLVRPAQPVHDLGPNHEPIEIMPLAGDVAIGIGLLIVVAALSESLLRRREAGNT